MTNQITIKLNEALFRPLMDDIDSFTGPGMTKSDSDLVAKCVFFTHCFMHEKRLECGGKTLWDTVQQQYGIEKSEMILDFLKQYYEYTKKK